MRYLRYLFLIAAAAVTALAADSSEAKLCLDYPIGQSVPNAAKVCRLAADQGSSYAQYNLGFMYAKGQAVPQDYKQAMKWYRLAADQGDSYAQVNLGVMYAKGQAVPQDYVQAHMWFNLADASGEARGVKDRDSIAQKMTAVQIAKAQRLAREWKAKPGR
jgi:uncharacterized protein